MSKKSAFNPKRLIHFSVAKLVIGIKSDVHYPLSTSGNYFK